MLRESLAAPGKIIFVRSRFVISPLHCSAFSIQATYGQMTGQVAFNDGTSSGQVLDPDPDEADEICTYSRSRKVGNSIASIPKSKVQGIPVLCVLKKVSNFWGLL